MFPATTWISQHVSSAHYCWWSSALILHGIPEVGTSYIYRNIYHTGLWIHFEPKPPLESSSSSSSSSGNENLFAFFSIILAAVRRSYSSVKPECQYCHFSLALCQGARGRKTADSNSKCQPFDNLWKKRRIWCSLHSNHRAGAYLREKYGGIFASPPPPPHPPPPLHFNLLQTYTTARVHSTWKTLLPKPLSSRWSGIKRLPHTHVGWNGAHTCSPHRPLLFSLSAKGKASKQVKALSQLLFSWLIHF